MSHFLRDPLWPTVLGVLLLAEAIVIFFLQARRRGFSYEIIEDMPLFPAEYEFTGKLQIVYDRKPIQNVRIVSIKLANTGNVPVAAADFETPISIEFGPASQLLAAEVVASDPPGIASHCTLQTSSVALQPMLWNAGDLVILKCLVARAGAEVILGGRVRGVKTIRKTRADLRWKLMAGAAAIPALLGAFLSDEATNRQLRDPWHLGGALILLGVLIFFKAMYDEDKRQRVNKKLLVRRLQLTDLPSKSTDQRQRR